MTKGKEPYSLDQKTKLPSPILYKITFNLIRSTLPLNLISSFPYLWPITFQGRFRPLLLKILCLFPYLKCMSSLSKRRQDCTLFLLPYFCLHPFNKPPLKGRLRNMKDKLKTLYRFTTLFVSNFDSWFSNSSYYFQIVLMTSNILFRTTYLRLFFWQSTTLHSIY